MRLINAHTLKLEKVRDETVKTYAILSHRWEDDGEVSFQDMQNSNVAFDTTGYTKIQKSCAQAVKDGYSYVWVDTCCINSESSAELSEAINSMYRWYKASAVCYVFLADVLIDTVNGDTNDQQISNSVWFTRGWTLQELLAPQHVVFYDLQWELLGTKQTLSKLLTQRSGIGEASLNGEPLSRRSIAHRMSWASERVTTRKEDIAYCLLGIFDVNMPMLYGEGEERAFLRLQEEIIKRSDDHTIFAWPIRRHNQPGLLADSPQAFAKCQNVRPMVSRKGRSSYSLSNRGLSIKLMAAPFVADTYIVRLECDDAQLPADDCSAEELRLGMFLRRLSEDDQYARVKYKERTFMRLKASAWDQNHLRILQVPRPIKPIEINVPQQFNEFSSADYKNRIHGFRIATPELLKPSRSCKDRLKCSATRWEPQERILFMRPMLTKTGDTGTTCSLDISLQDCSIKVIRLGFDFELRPVCFIAAEGRLSAKEVKALYRKTPFNFNSDSRGFPWTELDQAQFSGIHARFPFDQLGWCEIRNGTAIELVKHSGLSAVKGDRIYGCCVRIGDLATLRIVRGETQDGLVWDVYLDNFKDST